MKEDAATIRKSMVQIGELVGKGDALSFNQATRWVMTKEASGRSLRAAPRQVHAGGAGRQPAHDLARHACD